MSKYLILPLKIKWFEMTAPNGKTEDYREITPYWKARLTDQKSNSSTPIEQWRIKKFERNIMTLGYPSKDDVLRIKVFEHAGIEIRTGNPEWGAEPNKLYFVIKHGKQIEL